MQDELNARVLASIESCRKRKEASKKLAELMFQHPRAVAMEIQSLVSRQVGLWHRNFYERYNFDVRRWVYDHHIDLSSLPQGRNPRETTEIVEDALAYVFWEGASKFSEYMERTAIEFGVDRNLAICVGWLFLVDRAKEPADWRIVGSELPQALKEELLAEMAGQVGIR